MKEEELEWFEKNWNNGKSLFKGTVSSMEYKLHRKPWYNYWDAPHQDSHYSKDRICWKTNRKTHYKIPKVKKEKKRKDSEKEHWRHKKPYHSWGWRSKNSRMLWDAKIESRNREKKVQMERIAELKKVGHWIFHWKHIVNWSIYKREFTYYKVDLNDPYDCAKVNTRNYL